VEEHFSLGIIYINYHAEVWGWLNKIKIKQLKLNKSDLYIVTKTNAVELFLNESFNS